MGFLLADIQSLKKCADTLQDKLTVMNTNECLTYIMDLQNNLDNVMTECLHLVNSLRESQDNIRRLEIENNYLRAELANKPNAGRKRKYDDKKRAEIAKYRETHSYKETLTHFNISSDTLNRIMREHGKQQFHN